MAMTPVAEARMFRVGRYTVRQQMRSDNPAFAQYVVFKGDKLIGKSFSVPDEGCCRWLERQSMSGPVYASISAPLTRHTTWQYRWRSSKAA